MKSIAAGVVAGMAALLISGCATTPEEVEELEQARSTVQELEQQPMAQSVAAQPLSRARQALSRADALHESGEPIEEIRHQAYLADRHARIGLEMVGEARAMERIEAAEAERREMQLEARTLEAERAEARAHRQAAAAEESRAAAAAAQQEAERLQRELADLEAEQTRRGIVLTLDDNVLFETESAELKEGAFRSMDRLAEFLDENQERRLLIEGHTDARGTEDFNQDLSRRRAEAVAEALMERGIASDRLRPVGLGEAYPVASNDTSAGRQENRRVEVVVSDKNGAFPDAANRTVARGDRDR